MLRCLDVLKRIETYSPWNALLSYLNGEWTVRTRWVNTECTLGEWLVNRIWWVLMNDESVQRINRAQTRQQSEQQMHGHWYVNALWWQEDQFFWIAQELSSHCIYMYNVYSERMVSAWWIHDKWERRMFQGLYYISSCTIAQVGDSYSLCICKMNHLWSHCIDFPLFFLFFSVKHTSASLCLNEVGTRFHLIDHVDKWSFQNSMLTVKSF